MKTQARAWTLCSLGSIAVAAVASGCSSASSPVGTTASASSTGAPALFPGATPITGIAGMCLDDQGDGTGNFNPIQLYSCNQTAAQAWKYLTSGEFVGPSGKCLDVMGGATTPGTRIDLYDCNGTSAQRWYWGGDGPIVSALSSPGQPLCLDDQSANTSNGNPIQLWPCNGTAAQSWTMYSLFPSAEPACTSGYTSTPADFSCRSGGSPAAKPPVLSGHYRGTDGTSSGGQGNVVDIDIDVASPKDGSSTWTVTVYAEGSGCSSPSVPWGGAPPDGRATIECGLGGRCWFDVDDGTYTLWSPTDPYEVSFLAPDGKEYRYVRVGASAPYAQCGCVPPPAPPPPPSPPPIWNPPPQYIPPVIVGECTNCFGYIPQQPFNTGVPIGTGGFLGSPLVLSFGAPLQFTNKPVAFDFYANGTDPMLDWLAPPTAFLTLDLNGNGTIDNGAELFGTSTVIQSTGQLASDGFAALAQYDANGDGKIDATDPVYARLMLWTDLNGDAVAEPNELVRASDAAIASISIHATQQAHTPVDSAGTYVASSATFSYYPSRLCQTAVASGTISDVWFGVNAPGPASPPTLPLTAYGSIGSDAGGNLDSAILQCVLRNGGQAAVGAPADNGGGAAVHAWNTGVTAAGVTETQGGDYGLGQSAEWGITGGSVGGVAQDFAGGTLGSTICMHETGSSSAWMVRGAIRDAYFGVGGASSFLGYPVGDEYVDPASPPPAQVQQFEGGYVAWDPSLGKFMPHTPDGCDAPYCLALATCGQVSCYGIQTRAAPGDGAGTGGGAVFDTPAPPPPCAPATCASLGASCGSVSDGCGGTLSCGSCALPQTCGGSGHPNVCGSPGCKPRTCASVDVWGNTSHCGSMPDGCGGTLSCGSCGYAQTCGAAFPNVCGIAS